MNRRGFLFAAGAGLGATALSVPPSVRARATGNVLPAAQTPDPAVWPDNNIRLAWLGHATVLINFYGVRVLTDPAFCRRIGIDLRLATLGPATHPVLPGGVRAVAIDRVLAEADAAKPSLYQHFGCKDQLVASYLERRTENACADIEAYLADTPPSQRALKCFDWVVEWAESKDFRGCPLQRTVTELTDATHPARAIAHDQREWFTERFLEWKTAAGVTDAKAMARALVVLFDGAVAGSEVDGLQWARDARWMARKL
jgi:AcrR family transcriptional regulator